MPQIKLHLINQTNFNLIFDYKNNVYFVPFKFDIAVEVESGSLLYVHPEGKPEGYQHINMTMENDADINCRFELGKLRISATEPNKAVAI